MVLKTLRVAIAAALLAGTAGDTLRADALSQTSGTAKAQKQAPAKPGAATRSAQPDRPSDRKPWWLDEGIKKELALTAEQVKKVDQIYNSAKDELTSYRDARDRERKELDRLVSERKAERWVVQRQIDKFETWSSNYNKLWRMTLYLMHRELTPDQYIKLEAIRDRDRRNRDPRRHQ